MNLLRKGPLNTQSQKPKRLTSENGSARMTPGTSPVTTPGVSPKSTTRSRRGATGFRKSPVTTPSRNYTYHMREGPQRTSQSREKV